MSAYLTTLEPIVINLNVFSVINTVYFSFFDRDRERNTGVITCNVCVEDFQTNINCILKENKLQHILIIFVVVDIINVLIKPWCK